MPFPQYRSNTVLAHPYPVIARTGWDLKAFNNLLYLNDK